MARSKIAVVGMSGQFLESRTVDEFWRNVKEGRECVGANARVEAKSRADAGHWVELTPTDDRDEWFDAGLFGLSPRETDRMEPQQRAFLEAAWCALEDGGYSVDTAGARVGVFGGANFTSYWSLEAGHHLPEALDEMVGCDKDYLATRVSHHLGLQGPAMTVQSACSTSLVATHLACQSLIMGECDAALAGGVSMTRPRLLRYFHMPGGILSPDGFCRPFDADALGTVFTEGVGMVLLMRLEDALARNHPIYAVIRGSAINNDGGSKPSYMAPSIGGQERVIREALRVSGVRPAQIGYVEAHGTATVLGDAIELAALTRIYRGDTDKVGYCRLGSVKANIGHTVSAAGVAGLMKASLALKHGVIPPTVNFQKPNPDLDLMTSPFSVSAEAAEWRREKGTPHFAAVSSFGVGGTNAHAILEEPPRRPRARARRSNYVLTVSARSDAALAAAADQLRIRLKGASRSELADVAYTLNVGRKALDHRTAIVCRDVADARKSLAGRAQSTALSGRVASGKRTVGFLFPGQGSQYPGMGRQLYQEQATFRRIADECIAGLRRHHGPDLTPLLGSDCAVAEAHITQTKIAQPLIFTIEYALGATLMELGVRPNYAMGHSVGEFAAAALAGAISLDDALRLVSLRGALMQALPTGAMLSVSAAEDLMAERLPDDLDLAAVNGPRQCVVSGAEHAVDAFAETLAADQIHTVRLKTSHAFHSQMMTPMLAEFGAALAKMPVRAPSFPFVSNVTGSVVLYEALRDPEYWLRHVRQPVLFYQGLQALVGRGVDLLVEVGPGRQLSGLAQQAGVHRQGVRVINTMHNDLGQTAESAVLMRALSRVWLEGGAVDWTAVHRGEKRRMVAVGNYPFQRDKYRSTAISTRPTQRRGKLDVSEWRYVPTWRRTVLAAVSTPLDPADCWLVMHDGGGAGLAVVETLAGSAQRVVSVALGFEFIRTAPDAFTVNPDEPDGFAGLFEALKADGVTPRRLAHMWGLDPALGGPGREAFDQAQTRGVYSLARILRAHREVYGREPLAFEIILSGAHDVTGDEALQPAKASAIAFARVAPQENAHVKARVIDIDARMLAQANIADRIVEALASPTDPVIALRQAYWWAQGFERAAFEPDRARGPALKRGGVYLITGGMGHIGMIFARHLARAWQARLILVGRSPLADPAADGEAPQPSQRAAHLAELEALGADAIYLQADLADLDAVRRLRSQAHARFGVVDGVIFGAGALDARGGVDEIEDTQCYDANYAGKVHGLANFLQVFGDDPLDFGIVLSSISTVLGGMALCAYSAANQIADLLVFQHRQAGHENWITSNWDLWVGGHFSDTEERLLSHMLALGIQAEEGAQALEDVLSPPRLPQVIVSTYDLQSRFDVWVKGGGGDGATTLVQHKRPSLATAYVEVEGEFEQRLAQIWSQVLGIETIGRDDDFFELGGHSLLAVQVAVQIQEIVPPETPAANLYETPTVRELAAFLSGAEA